MNADDSTPRKGEKVSDVPHLTKFRCRYCAQNSIVERGSVQANESICPGCYEEPEDREKRRHKQWILLSVLDAEVIRVGELYEWYSEIVDEPRTRRQVRKYLDELEDDGELERIGKGPKRRVVIR